MDIIDITNISVYGISIVPFITGLMQMVKTIVPVKFIPFISTITGIIIGVLVIVPDNTAAGIMVGAAAGLAAVKLYDVGEDHKNNKNDANVKDL